MCEKFTYPTKNDARFDLQKIREDKRTHKKPVRAYECDKCSGWHLTSITYEEFKRLERSKKNAVLKMGIAV